MKSRKNNDRLKLIIYSILSGVLACIVSVFMKLAFNLASISIITNIIDKNSLLINLIRLIFIGLSIISNLLMWLFYTKSLQLSTNTLLATSINKLSNFIFTTLISYLLFNDKLTIKWFIGIQFLFVGILILNLNQVKQNDIKQD